MALPSNQWKLRKSIVSCPTQKELTCLQRGPLTGESAASKASSFQLKDLNRRELKRISARRSEE
jgi:hypothetical protein